MVIGRERLAMRKEQILAIAERHGARNVRIFGSVAREDSDIDFLVDLEPGRSLFDLGGLLSELRKRSNDRSTSLPKPRCE